MVHPIVYWPEAVLNTPAKDVTDFGPDLQKLIAEMWESMYAAKGIGLAAPQIGIPLRLTVIDTTEQGGERFIMANPVIEAREEPIEWEEACLSVPGESGKTKRFRKVTVRYQDENGNPATKTAEGITAVAIQHETDHLNGTVYVMHLSAMKRDIIRERMKKRKRWRARGE
ncbi:MAG: peptide deformylase [Myxococcales bacterium]